MKSATASSQQSAPVVLFGYNRPHHLRATLDALSQCAGSQECDLFIFCDGPKSPEVGDKVAEVIAVAKAVAGFKSITVETSEENKGLGRSVISGVGKIVEAYGAVIVLEDDIVVSNNFLAFMNAALAEYQNEKKVFSISGYCPPTSSMDEGDVYFVPRICSWGWATWKDRWLSVDWSIQDYPAFIKSEVSMLQFCRAGRDMLDMLINQVEGESESWAIRFDYGRYKFNDALTLYPSASLVNNVGMDGSGAHGEQSVRYITDLSKAKTSISFVKEVSESLEMTEKFSKFYKRRLSSLLAIYSRRLGVHGASRYIYRRFMRRFFQ